jgi:hypothetical protein
VESSGHDTVDILLARFMKALEDECDASTPMREQSRQPRSSPEVPLYTSSESLRLPLFVEQRLHDVAKTLMDEGAVW